MEKMIASSLFPPLLFFPFLLREEREAHTSFFAAAKKEKLLSLFASVIEA